MTDLAGKHALVTGGSRGIGAAIALALTERGAEVAISYERAEDRARQIVQPIEAKGRRGVAIKADSANPLAVRPLVNDTSATLGGLDILVNNAGASGAHSRPGARAWGRGDYGEPRAAGADRH